MSARYGARTRKKLEAVRKKQQAKYACPRCGKKKVKRIDFARWSCKACGLVFAGGAFEPQTSAGVAVLKALSERSAETAE